MGKCCLVLFCITNVKYRCPDQLGFDKFSREEMKEFKKMHYCAHECDIHRKN